MENADAELIADFVIESQEGLAGIEQQMLAIEAGGADIDVELVNAVFRTMHTIKGTAGFLGLDRIGTLAHGLEEVLNDMRNREIATSSDLVTTILHAADFMKGMINAVETSNEVEIDEYVTALQRYRSGAEPASATSGLSANPSASTAGTASVNTSPNGALREFLIECHDLLDRMEENLKGIQFPSEERVIRSMFRTMHTVKEGAGFLGLGTLEKLAHAAEKPLSRLRDGQCTWSAEVVGVLSTTVDKCREGLRLIETEGSGDALDTDALIEKLSEVGERVSEQNESSCTAEHPPRIGEILLAEGRVKRQDLEIALAEQSAGDPRPVGEILVQDGSAKSDDIVAALKSQQESRNSSLASVSEGNIRVDVALLDKLMTRVGELVLARNQILQYTNGLDDSTFISTAQRLNLITAELQESVMKTRMQPIGNVWAKFPRVVRDLASQLGKQVRIDMEGKETELDKTIVEAIKDPLTHLVRNSVDHGIESPEVRRAAGKPAEGRLLLRAYHEGGQVNIEITDDGAGLNLDRIRRKAVERGLVSADQAARMSERDASLLIFAPGFSTAEKVTSVSGRGVGMDVVKTNIERISGTIDLQSNLGSGTTIKIKIPLTLAIIPALIVTNDGDRYAIPQVSLLELVRLEGDVAAKGIEYVHGAPVYRLRGKLLPLVYLSERLGLTRGSDRAIQDGGADDIVNIVVLRANDRQFGLVVDKVNDTAEIVVKPLSRQLKGLSEYAGATIMGDGTVALILDVMGLALAAGLAAENREQATGAAASEDNLGVRTETLLVVDLGDSRRFALPTSMVSRLEKVQPSKIEFTNGCEVVQYRGAILPLVRLTEVFGGSPQNSEPDEELSVVVYADHEESCGFVVGRIVDVVETEITTRNSRQTNENLLGTAVIQQRVTDIVNLSHLARSKR